MFALWERNINHTVTMNTYENSKDNVILLVTETLGSCVFGGHRKCHTTIMHLNMDF